MLLICVILIVSYVLAVEETCGVCLGECCSATAAGKGPSPVDLGTAGDFAVLTKAGISTTTTSANFIVGDIGVSPAAATYITGFSLTKVGEYGTSGQVDGQVFAADYTSPTPSKMITAISDMQTAFADAAGRSLPTASELGAGDITGMTLPAGLYRWGSGLLIGTSGVTLTGGVNDVWIFQIAQTLTIANGGAITLAAGARAENIFWQTAGAVTIGTTAAVQGNILSATAITFNTGSTLVGRVLAQTAGVLDGASFVKPSVYVNEVICCGNDTLNVTLCNDLNGQCYLPCHDDVYECTWCAEEGRCETCNDGYHVDDSACIRSDSNTVPTTSDSLSLKSLGFGLASFVAISIILNV